MEKNSTEYDRVIAAVQEITGKEWGAASWLAEQIGETRQAVDHYRRRGYFPLKHVNKIADITEIGRDMMLAGIEPEIVRLSRKWRVSVREAELRIMRVGLAHLK